MPIYEYRCPDCGHDFEALQKFSDDPIKDCPVCKAANVKKRISATSFVLKGGGWYKDHYGLKSGSSSEGASSGAAAPAAGGGASGGDSAGASTAAPAASTPAASSTGGSTPSTPAAPAK